MTALIGLPAPPAAAGEVLLAVPYRSQLDDSPYAGANCGPASIAMVLGAYAVDVPTDAVRAMVNDLQGTWDDYSSGTSPESIAAIVGHYELRPTVRRWTLDEVRAQLDAGVPVVPQVWYPGLPGREDDPYRGDHFVVLLGYRGESFVYHDPIPPRGGPYTIIGADQLERAWAGSDLPWTGVAVAGSPARPAVPPLATPTPLPTPTPEPTATAVPTATPTVAPSPTATATATASPTATATPPPTATPTAVPVVTAPPSLPPAATFPDAGRSPAVLGAVLASLLGHWGLVWVAPAWRDRRPAPGRPAWRLAVRRRVAHWVNRP